MVRKTCLSIGSVLLAVVLAACGAGQPFEDPAQRETREASESSARETSVAYGTQASTVVAMQATVDYAVIMATQMGQLNAQNQALQATLTALGGGQLTTNNLAGAALPGVQPTLPAAVVTSANPVPNVVVNTTPGAIPTTAPSFVGPGTPVGQIPQGIPNQAQPGAGVSAVQTAGAASGNLQVNDTMSGGAAGQTSTTGITYSNPTLSTNVDDDGCGIDNVTNFASTQPEIYMVITGNGIQRGVQYNVNWNYSGSLAFDSGGWTSDGTYDELCIWFSALGPFDPGSWTAEFTENGVAIATIDFTINP